MSKAALLKRVFLLTLAVLGAVALYLLSYCVVWSICLRAVASGPSFPSTGGFRAMPTPDTWVFAAIPSPVKEAMVRLWANVDPKLDPLVKVMDDSHG
jgi:hypothetical protein